MGYTTDFTGSFKLSRQATKEEIKYINTFSQTRRIKRDVHKLMKIYEGKYGLPGVGPTATPEEIYGIDGEWYVNNDFHGCPSIIDYNTPPGHVMYNDPLYKGMLLYQENIRRSKECECQPSLWCQWILNDEGTELMWDEGEKFYNYIDWLNYLIKMFFTPWGIKLHGVVEYQGENPSDKGEIFVSSQAEIRDKKIESIFDEPDE